jgi:hypothetical protein
MCIHHGMSFFAFSASMLGFVGAAVSVDLLVTPRPRHARPAA